MTEQPETKIQRAIQKWVRSQGGICVKVHGNEYQRKGDPDLRGSITIQLQNGRKFYVFFQFEVKVPGEHPDPLQEIRIAEWKKHGYASGWGCSIEDFQDMIRNFVYDDTLLYSLDKAWQL